MPSSMLYLVSTLIWGSTWLAITYQFGAVPPGLSVAYRFLLAGGLLLAWCRTRGGLPRFGAMDAGFVALQGVLMFGVSYVLVYEAERHITSGLMAVLNSILLVMNLLGMRIAFAKPIDAKSALGAALGIGGIVLVFWPELTAEHGSDAWLGVAYGLGAASLASMGNLVAHRNRSAGLPLLPTIGYGMLCGGTIALAITLLSGKALVFDVRPSYLASLLYLAVFGSIVAFGCYLTLQGRIGVVKAGYVAVAIPIVALLLSGWLEGFVWRPSNIAGMVLAALGNVVMLADFGPLLARWRPSAYQAR